MPLEFVEHRETRTVCRLHAKTMPELWRNAAVERICREISHATKHEHRAFLSTSLTPSQTN